MQSAEDIARELERFYRDYIEIFNSEDLDRVADSFSYPCAVISGERGLAPTANRDENRTMFGRLMPALKQRGWARSDIVRIKAWAMGENLGMLVADVTRNRADNAVYERLRGCYTLRRDRGAWKIVTISEVSDPFLGPGDLPR